jgi:hypothetical protein
MKNLIALAALIGATSLSFGQGYVSFYNSSISLVSVGTWPGLDFPTTVAPAGVGNYYYELLVAPTAYTTTDPSLDGWTDTGVLGESTATAGRMMGYTYTDSTGCYIPGYAANSSANFVVFGWSADAGTTFAQAWANWDNGLPMDYAQFGISSVATDIPLSVAGGPYNDVWGRSSVGQIQGMVLTDLVVPEPGTMALAGVGAAVLLTLRRRK